MYASKQRDRSQIGLSGRIVLPVLLLLVGACDAGQLVRVGLSEPGVIIGDGPIAFEPFLSLAPFESGGDVDILDVLPTSDPQVSALQTWERSKDCAWSTVLRFVDVETGVVLSSYPIVESDLCWFPTPVDISADGAYLGVCPGGGFSDVGLVDSEGNTLWSFDGGAFEIDYGAANEIDAGDIDGDGDLEFCVGFSRSLGCFDKEGRTLWRVNDGDWYDQVKIVNGGTSTPRVLAVRKSPTPPEGVYYLEVRDGSGELLATKPVATHYFYKTVPWPPHQEEPTLMAQVGTHLTFRDLEGESVFEYPVPASLTEFDSFVLDIVVLDHGAEQFLVVNFAAEIESRKYAFVGLGRAVRSALVFYNSLGDVVHFEVLDDSVYLSSPAPHGTVYVTKGSSVFVLNPPGV